MKQSGQFRARRISGPAAGYAVAVVGTAAAALLRWVIGKTVGEIPAFITFYPVALASAALGGKGPGLVATLLTALAAAFFFIEPRGQLAIAHTPDAVALAIYVAINISISLVGGRLRTVHQRVKAQNAQLQHSDEQLRLQATALQSSANAMFITDRQGAMRWTNEAFTRLTGYTAAEALAQNPRLLKSGRHDAVFYKQMWETILAGQVWQGELVNKRKDGSLYTDEMTITPVQDARDTIINFIAVMQDVTPRKEAEARMLALSQRRAADLAAMKRLHEVSTRFARQENLNSLLEAILDAAIAIIGANKGYVQLTDRNSDELGIIVQRGFDEAFIEFFNHIKPGVAACGTAMQTKQRVIVEDITLSPIFLAEPRALQLKLAAGMRALVCTPLLARTGQSLGVISAHFFDTHRPSDRDLDFLDLLARQAEEFIERTQAEQALREQAQLARLRADATQMLQQTGAIRELSNGLAALLVEQLDAAFARVWTLDPAGQTLQLQASAGLYTHLDGAHSRIPVVGQLKIGRIAQERRPLVTNQVVGDPDVPNQDWARREGLLAFAGFPLLLEGRLLGVVALFARHKLSPAAVETFGAVAGTLAQALGRKEAEEALRERNAELDAERARWQGVVEGIADEVWTADAQGRMSLLNLPAVTAMGLEAFEGKDLREVLQEVDMFNSDGHPRLPQDAPLLRSLRGEIVRGEEIMVHRRTGNRRWRQFSSAPTRDGAGAITGAVAIVRDVTERKRIEEALRESERQFRALADSIPNLAWWANGDGYITWYNHRWYEYTGTTAEQMEGWGWEKVHDPEMLPAVLERWKASIESGTPFEMEFPLRGADGRFRWFLTRIIPLQDAAGKVVRWFGTNTDVSATREAREVLARTNVDLERAVDERTAKLRETIEELEGFSYSIVHDMRAPLRAMENFAALAQESCAGCPKPEGLDYYRRMRIASNRMDQLIIDALNYSKVVREELPLGPVDIGKLLRGMVDTYPNLQPPAVVIQLELDGLLARGNESALTQVFGNLLGNAVKFVAPGVIPRVKVWAEVMRSAECGVRSQDGEQSRVVRATEQRATDLKSDSELSAPQSAPGLLRIWIEDNGIGISPAAHDKIFGMFQRMHRVDEYPGTGIGLTIVRKAMERMGGQVGVESEPGKGSKFWIELPRGEQSRLPEVMGQ